MPWVLRNCSKGAAHQRLLVVRFEHDTHEEAAGFLVVELLRLGDGAAEAANAVGNCRDQPRTVFAG